MNQLEIVALAKRIKAVVSDVDGVFTDNRVFEGTPHQGKFRSYYDGQGVSLLRAIGIKVHLVTNEKSNWLPKLVEKWNNLPSSRSPLNPQGWPHVDLSMRIGGVQKADVAEAWLLKNGLTFADSAGMGDDLTDLALLQRTALVAVPFQAEEVVKKISHFISTRPGGYGAFRDFANFILEARGIDPATLPPQ